MNADGQFSDDDSLDLREAALGDGKETPRQLIYTSLKINQRRWGLSNGNGETVSLGPQGTFVQVWIGALASLVIQKSILLHPALD